MFELGSLFGKTRKLSSDINLLKPVHYKENEENASENMTKIKK